MKRVNTADMATQIYAVRKSAEEEGGTVRDAYQAIEHCFGILAYSPEMYDMDTRFLLDLKEVALYIKKEWGITTGSTIPNRQYTSLMDDCLDIFGHSRAAIAVYAAVKNHPDLWKRMSADLSRGEEPNIFVRHLLFSIRDRLNGIDDDRWKKIIDVVGVIKNSGTALSFTNMNALIRVSAVWNEYGSEVMPDVCLMVSSGISLNDIGIALKNGIDPETLIANHSA